MKKIYLSPAMEITEIRFNYVICQSVKQDTSGGGDPKPGFGGAPRRPF